MDKRAVIIISFTCLLVLSLFALHRFGFLDRSQLRPGEVRQVAQPNSTELAKEPVEYQLEMVAQDLVVPWSLAFTSSDRILITERPGRVRVIENDILKPEPLITFPEVSSNAEEGLMGLAVDPSYQANRFVYAAYAYLDQSSNMWVRVVRLIDQGSTAQVNKTIIDQIPAARFHAGGRILFGPDGKLYVTTGDALNTSSAQDLDSLAGKILRVNSDGSIPSDNPYPNSPVYSLGHRNPQGLAWHPQTSQLWSSEHGPSGFDGPAGGDEINLIVAGGNYGWPTVSHERSQSGMIDPIHVFTPAEAPGSAMFYSGSVFPQYKDNLFVGALRGEGLIRMQLKDNLVIMVEKLAIDVGRIREVVESPEGIIYFTTSNRDGRGSNRAGDDKVYRLTPLQ